MTRSEYDRKLRTDAIALGRCRECRIRPHRLNRKSCQVCGDKKAARVAKHVRAGLCLCGSKRWGTQSKCRRCLGFGREYQAKRRALAIEHNRCWKCRLNSPETGMRMCVLCNSKNRAATRQWYQDNREYRNSSRKHQRALNKLRNQECN